MVIINIRLITEINYCNVCLWFVGKLFTNLLTQYKATQVKLSAFSASFHVLQSLGLGMGLFLFVHLHSQLVWALANTQPRVLGTGTHLCWIV